MTKLSNDKKIILLKLLDWFNKKEKKQYITIGGYAGTGKTTLISYFRKELKKINKKKKIAFCSYTGKAARVLRQILKQNHSIFKSDFIGTIHSLIYTPIENVNHEIIGWEKKKVEELKYDLIILDEASMVDKQIWNDILSYKISIIAVGDHGQLPPIKEKFNLMEKPDYVLTEIHRQVKKNPIIQLSISARLKGEIDYGSYSEYVKKFDRTETETQEIISELLENYKPDTLILCGYNYTRIKLNTFIRKSLGFESLEPMADDRVICLRNNHEKQIFNGMLGTIKQIMDEDENWYFVKIEMDEGELYKGLIYKDQFNSNVQMNFSKLRSKSIKGDLFDFGYALTVHKAQGSQAKKVLLFEERFKQMDDEMWRRWLYTAVTRAQEELYIFG